MTAAHLRLLRAIIDTTASVADDLESSHPFRRVVSRIQSGLPIDESLANSFAIDLEVSDTCAGVANARLAEAEEQIAHEKESASESESRANESANDYDELDGKMDEIARLLNLEPSITSPVAIVAAVAALVAVEPNLLDLAMAISASGKAARELQSLLRDSLGAVENLDFRRSMAIALSAPEGIDLVEHAAGVKDAAREYAARLRTLNDHAAGRGESGRRLVFLASPYAGDMEKNGIYVLAAAADSLKRGEAPFAPHLLYPMVLSDVDDEDRAEGIACGLAWGRFAAATVVYADLGVSPGMEVEIERANLEGRPVEFRKILS